MATLGETAPRCPSTLFGAHLRCFSGLASQSLFNLFTKEILSRCLRPGTSFSWKMGPLNLRLAPHGINPANSPSTETVSRYKQMNCVVMCNEVQPITQPRSSSEFQSVVLPVAQTAK